ncbi:MAG: nucleoside hydrolase [Bacilli bacterium]
MEKQKIILDCDPGHDDATAIMMAAKNPNIDLLGISVVAGNQVIERTAINAMNVCQYLGLDIPVYQGCGQPMIRQRPIIAADIHGKTGLDGPNFKPLKRKIEKKHAVNFIIDTLMAGESDISVVTTGPMTNLAMAMRMEPKIIPKIKQVVFMGGSYGNGNVTPAAEFNIIADADAAYVVFTSGRPLVMVGLDVTRQALCFPSIVERMSKNNNPAGKLFTDLMTFFCKTQKEVFGWEGGPLHDPITIAYLIDPTVLKTKFVNAEVDIRSVKSYGRTNCDMFDYNHWTKNCNVAYEIDVEKFWNIVENCIKRYS